MLVRGVYENLISRNDPLAEGALPPIFDREHFIKYVSRRYFRASVEAVNRLFQFLNDPRTYADGKAPADLELFIKVQCLVRLMFADLAALNLSTDLHQRHRFAFSIFDKLANLRLAFHPDRNEGEWFKAFLSIKHGQKVAGVLRRFLDDFAPLGRVLERLCLQTYADIAKPLQKVIDQIPAGRPRPSTQEMLRTLRNLEHGTMLSKGVPFEDMFYQSDIEVPTGVLYLPLFFVLAFCFDPLTTIGVK